MDEPPADGPWSEALRQPEDLIAGPGTGSLASRLDRWLADARVEGSADARARERWLHAAAEADATFGGVLLDLAERGAPVAVSTAGGRRHHGDIGVVGGDFVALCLTSGTEVLLPLAAIATVRTAPNVDAALGERVVTTDLRLPDVLAQLTAERVRVLVVASGVDPVAGELRSVGRDVATVRTDADPPAMVYVPLTGITEVTLG